MSHLASETNEQLQARVDVAEGRGPDPIVHAAPLALNDTRTACCGAVIVELGREHKVTGNPGLVTCPADQRVRSNAAIAHQLLSARARNADPPTRPFAGPIAHLGSWTVDGRLLAALTVGLHKIPVMAIDRPGADGHAGQTHVGAIESTRISMGADDDAVTLWASGYIDARLPTGIPLPCGIDVDIVSADPDIHPRTQTLVDEIGLHILTGRLMGLTVYLPAANSNPAFPDTHIVIEAPE